jgi:DNA adenine methylase
MSFFRYPGGKSRIRGTIVDHLNVYSERVGVEYREPFLGGGSVALSFVEDNPYWSDVWINDKDVGISCLWTSLLRFPQRLLDMVASFVPSVDEFYRMKDYLSGELCPGTDDELVDIGFSKLAIHQLSYSGLGVMSGGPLGGKSQKSKYPIDCRWSVQALSKGIRRNHKILSSLNVRGNACSSTDFSEMILADGDALLYLDPPYYVKGNQLYHIGFSSNDHNRLCSMLCSCTNPWILSYDDCPEVRSMYEWACVEEVPVNYTTGGKGSRQKVELLIYPASHKELVHGILR